MDKPVTPRGINHLVLNVRDMEESHRFWTKIVGFRQVGQLTPRPDRPNPPMRFYSGDKEGETHHHDIALVENRDLPPPPGARAGEERLRKVAREAGFSNLRRAA
jgi:catechol 2,3-dioxygenase